MVKKDDNDIIDKIGYAFCAIIVFAVMFPIVFPLHWLFLILDDEDPITWECFAKLFSPKFWYNTTKDTTHDNWN